MAGENKEGAIVVFNAENLISQAIDKNVPIETMEKLLGMRRELKAEWAKERFDAAMAAFQGECPVIKKTKTVMNKDGKTVRYVYAPLDEIVRQVGATIAKHGLSYTVTVKNEEGAVTAVVRVTHVDGHSQDSDFRIPIDPDAYMNPAQKVASALTFAKRYAFCNAFGILTGDEDDDSQASGDPEDAKAAKTFGKALEALKAMDAKAVKDCAGRIAKSSKYSEAQKDRFAKAATERLAEIGKAGNAGGAGTAAA